MAKTPHHSTRIAEIATLKLPFLELRHFTAHVHSRNRIRALRRDSTSTCQMRFLSTQESDHLSLVIFF